jgi:flagellar operon protein
MSIEVNPALLVGISTAAQPGVPATAPRTAPTGPADGQTAPATPGVAREQPSGPSFAEVLRDASEGTPRPASVAGGEPLHFSKHALERAQRRGIQLDPATLTRLEEGVGRAAGKGARDSVVLVDGTAFVVSVNNRTVVTAVSPEHMREHVFTNIDSAVLA